METLARALGRHTLQGLGGLLISSLLWLGAAQAQEITGTFRLMVLGDSLTDPNWSGIASEDAFPENIEDALEDRGYDVRVIKLSRSGDVAYEGFLRLEEWLAEGNVPPDGVIVELGTNDALQQKPLPWTENDLRMILQIFQELDVEVLLTGAYGSYSAPWTGFFDQAAIDAFEVLYPRLAAEYETLLYPYFLAGVLDDPETYTSDNLHPNAAGVDLIVERILPEVDALLRKAGAEPAS